MKFRQVASSFSSIFGGLNRHEQRFMWVGAVVGALHFGADAVVALLLQSLFLQTFGESAGGGIFDFGSVEILIALTLGTAFIRGVIIWALEASSIKLEELFKFNVRKRIVRAVMANSELSSRTALGVINEESSRAAHALGFAYKSLGHATVSVGLVGILIYLAPQFTALIIGLTFFMALPVFLLVRVIKSNSELAIESWQKTHHWIVRGFDNAVYLRFCGKSKDEISEIESGLAANYKHQTKTGALAGINLGYVQFAGLTVLLGIFGVSQHLGSAPDIMVPLVYLMVRLVQKSSDLARTISNFTGQKSFLERVLLWRKKLAYDQKPVPANSQVAQGAVGPIGWQLENVSIGYRVPENDVTILQQVTGRIEPGQCLVLEGPSGSGKSTLLKLLLGQVHLFSGKVLVSVGSQQFDQRTLGCGFLGRIAYAGPQGFIFDGTIWENLVFGLRESVSREQAWEALERFGCDFLSRFERGLDTAIERDNCPLSTGEVQRLNMAAALLRRPGCLILDEATANLDRETEQMIIEGLRTLKGAVTMVIATHKGGLCELADQFWHMDSWRASSSPRQNERMHARTDRAPIQRWLESGN